MAGVITASSPSWIAPFTGLSPRSFDALVRGMLRQEVGTSRPGRPRSLPLEDRGLLVVTYWRTKPYAAAVSPVGRSLEVLSRSYRPLYRVGCSRSSSANGFARALFWSWTALWCPPATAPLPSSPRTTATPTTTRSCWTRRAAWSSPLADRCPETAMTARAWEESGAKVMVGRVTTTADGGYRGTGLVIPHRRAPGEELAAGKQQHNASHRRVHARVEHAFARMKTWKILRDCRHERAWARGRACGLMADHASWSGDHLP
ncbi:DDE superfamily endonuclease [Streptomyces sp. 2323.1]|nr:DDE superfamily endonuclease [Streptomyces sp. 2323.1]